MKTCGAYEKSKTLAEKAAWDFVKALPEDEKFDVIQINSNSTDILDYESKKKGWNVIVIGGAAISRGITLEGLSVSYFLRIAKTPVPAPISKIVFSTRDAFNIDSHII